MSIIPVNCLVNSDLQHLGNNLRLAVQKDRQELRGVNRSLAVHGELVERLYRRRPAPASPGLRH